MSSTTVYRVPLPTFVSLHRYFEGKHSIRRQEFVTPEGMVIRPHKMVPPGMIERWDYGLLVGRRSMEEVTSG